MNAVAITLLCLAGLRGLDAIGETLIHADDIDLFESQRALDRPWLET